MDKKEKKKDEVKVDPAFTEESRKSFLGLKRRANRRKVKKAAKEKRDS